MKLTFFFLLVFSMQITASVSMHGQVTLKMQNESIRDVFREIETQSPYRFFYNEAFADLNKRVNINVDDRDINSTLDELLLMSDMSYKVLDNNLVVIAPKKELQQLVVAGLVTDAETGEGIPGVSVVIQGTTTGTTTDINGNYSISISDGDAVLIFSFVGFTTFEAVVAYRTSIDVSLEPELLALDEVIVVGYGTQRRENLTGAIGMATGERLENRPITSIGHGLQGVIPNLNIEIRDGDPTTAANFNIRGYESISGGSPLILVDGIPMALERINPNDIVSVTVLKDAAAAAVYGARGAFGVILVETKKGEGKLNITISSETSLAQPIFHMDVITDPHLFVTNWNKAFNRTHGRTWYDQDYIDGTKRWVENPTDENAWGVHDGELRFYGSNDYINRTLTEFAPQEKYDLSISGKSENSSYYVSFGYLDKKGYLKNKEKNEKFNRYNILMKAEFEIFDWLTLEEQISFNSEVSDKPHFYHWDVNINSAARVAPVFGLEFPDLPYYLEPGDRDRYERYIGTYLNHTVFLPYLEEGGRNTFTNNDIWLTQGVTLTPAEGLTIKSDFSFNDFTRNQQDVSSNVEVFGDWRYANLINPKLTHGFSANDWIDNRADHNQYFLFNSYAEYIPDISDDHYLKVMAGFNQEWGRNTYSRARAHELIHPKIWDLNATSGTQLTWGGKSHVALRGSFFRLNYIYKEKYLFEINGRYDLTSRFPAESRSGFFPSASVGWIISNEPFMTGTHGWLSSLKLRASYGELGNQLLGSNYYPYISSMGSGMSNFMMSSAGRIPYVSPGGLISPGLTWETVASRNFGLDFSLLDQRLYVSADIYTRDTRDMLMRKVYPDVLGMSAPQENAADLRTSGWEMSVNWRDEIGQNWQYKLNFALSDNQTEITKYHNPTGVISEYYVGQKIGEIWGYVTEGIFQTQEELDSHADQSAMGANWKVGDIKYADLNGDGRIDAGSNTLDDPGDRKIIGSSAARYSFGINPEVSYKSLTLNAFFQGLFRDYLPHWGGHNAFYPFNSFFLIENYHLTDTWNEDNRDAYFAAPHVSANGHHKNIMPQSRYLQNASYIRLKNLMLSYNLPQNLVTKARMSNAEVYLSGMNLWEFTKMRKPLDPESVFTTTQEYYKQRIFSLGVRLTF